MKISTQSSKLQKGLEFSSRVEWKSTEEVVALYKRVNEEVPIVSPPGKKSSDLGFWRAKCLFFSKLGLKCHRQHIGPVLLPVMLQETPSACVISLAHKRFSLISSATFQILENINCWHFSWFLHPKGLLLCNCWLWCLQLELQLLFKKGANGA